MPLPDITELALRAAVNTAERSLLGDNDQTQSIKMIANRRAQEQITGSSDGSSMLGQFSLQSAAIDLALVGIDAAYSGIKSHLVVLRTKRLEFDKDIQEGVSTFMEPTNKEEKDLSLEQHVIKSYLLKTSEKENLSFATYLGIHSADLSTEKNFKFHSVLPYYRMSEALPQPVASIKPLDRQRLAISLFFKSALPEATGKIETSFKTDNTFLSFWVSAFRGNNYLNNRRAPRFIMMSMANLLWNLQHPVDTEVGFPLNNRNCIELCLKVETYLNDFLNPESPLYLKMISSRETKLLSFIRKVEIHVKGLRAAYVEELLRGFDMGEVANSAHRALRIMDEGLLKLLYKKYNPISKKAEPDKNAAEKLSYYIGFLNELITQNSHLVSVFDPCPKWIPAKNLWLNKKPQTVIDVLIIFSHLSIDDRKHYLKKIKESPVGTAKEFALTLSDLYKQFIKPIRAVSKIELGANAVVKKHEEVGALTASRFVAIVALVLKDFRINVDILDKYEMDNKCSPERPTDVESDLMSGRHQVEAINISANEGDKFYKWALSPYVTLMGGEDEKNEFDGMFKHQFRMTQMAELMDNVKELVKNYQSLLQHRKFQIFLLKCIAKVKDEYKALANRITEIQQCLYHDERINRSLQATLRPMMTDLNESFDEFARAAADFERVVGGPNFIIEQRDLLNSKLKVVNRQFESLFAEPSGIGELMADPAMNASPAASFLEMPSMRNMSLTDIRKSFAMRLLVRRCFDGLSPDSRKGYKGALLKGLMDKMDQIPSFSQEAITDVILELTHIVASYRKTSFFQASYGQTRSAKVLIKAIKDVSVNNTLPLADTIYMKTNVNIRALRDNDILDKLKVLREAKGWKEGAHQITEVAAISAAPTA